MTVIFRMDFHITSLAFWHFPMIRFLLNNQTHVFRRIFWETSREKSLKVSVKSEFNKSPNSVHGLGFKAGVGTKKTEILIDFDVYDFSDVLREYYYQ